MPTGAAWPGHRPGARLGWHLAAALPPRCAPGRTSQKGLYLSYTSNGLVLRVSLRGGPGFRELLRRVREVTLGAYAHQEVPLEQVVDALGVERRPDRSPLFQVMFALQNAPGTPLRLPGTTFIPEPVERGASIYEMALGLWETPEGFSGHLEYNTDLFETASRERLMADLLRLLDTVLAEPDRALGLDSSPLAASGGLTAPG